MAAKLNSAQKEKQVIVTDGKIEHRLARSNVIPSFEEAFHTEMDKLNTEVREWKEKSELSLRGQLSARMGFRPDFSEEVTAENIKVHVADQTGHKHLKILNKDPQIYASRIAVAVSSIRKGSSLSDQALKKILIQAAAGNYNTETKTDQNVMAENISSVNLQVVIRIQSLYFEAVLLACRKTISDLLGKIVKGDSENIYKQQRIQIRRLIEKIQGNARVIQKYRQFVLQKQPDEKKRKLLYNQDIILNLNELEKEDLDKKRLKVIIHNAYYLVRTIRHCPLLFPIGHKIADKLIKHGRLTGKEHSMGYFLKAQLFADAYVLAFMEFENCFDERRQHYGKKTIDSFKSLASNYGTAYSKINEKTETGLKTAIAVEFADYIVNFYENYNNALLPALGMEPLPKAWIKTLLSKTKQALMSIDSSPKIEKLYLKLENIGGEIGIPM
ncbi:MAG: hypothetical protein HQM14_04410 [SAR324 cluster bacterium]|nr:hypothetical protein [SAR324 cluster bacterium]